MEFDEDKAEVLALAFANVSSSTNYSAELQRHKKDIEQNHAYQLADDAPVTEMTEHLNKEFAQLELNLAIKQLKKNSTPGEDQITQGPTNSSSRFRQPEDSPSYGCSTSSGGEIVCRSLGNMQSSYRY